MRDFKLANRNCGRYHQGNSIHPNSTKDVTIVYHLSLSLPSQTMSDMNVVQQRVRKEGWLYHLTPSSFLRLRPSTCSPRYFLLHMSTRNDKNVNSVPIITPTSSSSSKRPSKDSSTLCYLSMFEQRSDARPPCCAPLAQLELTSETLIYIKNNAERRYFSGNTPITTSDDASMMSERRSSMSSVARKDDDRTFTIKTKHTKWIMQCRDGRGEG